MKARTAVSDGSETGAVVVMGATAGAGGRVMGGVGGREGA